MERYENFPSRHFSVVYRLSFSTRLRSKARPYSYNRNKKTGTMNQSLTNLALVTTQSTKNSFTVRSKPNRSFAWLARAWKEQRRGARLRGLAQNTNAEDDCETKQNDLRIPVTILTGFLGYVFATCSRVVQFYLGEYVISIELEIKIRSDSFAICESLDFFYR